MGAHVHLYQCHLDLVDGGSSEELVPFERAPEHLNRNSDSTLKGDRKMSQRMQADVLYLDPAEAKPGIAVLVKQGFDVEPLVDWIDEAGPTVFYRIQINSTLDESVFFDWVQSSGRSVRWRLHRSRPRRSAAAASCIVPQETTMSTKNIRAEAFDVRIDGGLCCPHCGKPLASHTVEHRDRDRWRMVCQSCHRDIVVVESTESILLLERVLETNSILTSRSVAMRSSCCGRCPISAPQSF